MEYLFNSLRSNGCSYCHYSLVPEKWNSSWSSDEQHYKSTSCSQCKKKNWFRVPFSGSGHDALPKRYSPLESTVRKVLDR